MQPVYAPRKWCRYDCTGLTKVWWIRLSYASSSASGSNPSLAGISRARRPRAVGTGLALENALAAPPNRISKAGTPGRLPLPHQAAATGLGQVMVIALIARRFKTSREVIPGRPPPPRLAAVTALVRGMAIVPSVPRFRIKVEATRDRKILPLLVMGTALDLNQPSSLVQALNLEADSLSPGLERFRLNKSK